MTDVNTIAVNDVTVTVTVTVTVDCAAVTVIDDR
jgi:hypothetical protein